MEVTDTELIAAVVQRDDAVAFETLVARHAPRVRALVGRIIKNEHDLEEVVQDVFMRVYRSLERFRAECKFTTWLHPIAINTAIRRYQWNKRRGLDRSVSIDRTVDDPMGFSYVTQLPDAQYSPDRSMLMTELQSVVRNQMAALPDSRRTVLHQLIVDDLSYDQIAEQSGCKIGTVKSRINRARNDLRKRLQNQIA